MALYLGKNKIGNIKTGVAGKAEDLTNVLDAQESKLNALIASLDGKAAGGGVETCTVNIKDATGMGRYFALTATVLDDNGHIAYKDVNQASFPYLLSNVIVGAPIIMRSPTSAWFINECSGDGIYKIEIRDTNLTLVFSTTTTGELTANINTMN